jgi:hypothetical protein
MQVLKPRKLGFTACINFNFLGSNAVAKNKVPFDSQYVEVVCVLISHFIIISRPGVPFDLVKAQIWRENKLFPIHEV